MEDSEGRLGLSAAVAEDLVPAEVDVDEMPYIEVRCRAPLHIRTHRGKPRDQ